MTEDTENKKPGCLAPILWTVAAFLVTLVCAVFVGLMANESESNGMTATYIEALPFGALWSGAIGALIAYFAKPKSGAVRIGMPFGCGCLGGIVLLALIFVFFVAIFPAL